MVVVVDANDSGPGDVRKDQRLAFNRQTLTTVEAVGGLKSVPGGAKGSLRGVLARAA